MIAIIDYNAGNLASVAHAVRNLNFQCTITNDTNSILNAERIIFPGVGAAGSAMESLKRLGIDLALRDAFGQGKPLLGICLGTQIIMGHSDENDTECIGIVEGNVKPFRKNMNSNDGFQLKIPHMGWNRISRITDHPVLSGLDEEDEFYFVHSYYPVPDDSGHIIAITDYGLSFPSIIGFDNIIATQFHPEKSGEAGLKILKNFCVWKPC